MAKRLTWEELVKLEPRLLTLEAEAKVAGKGNSCFCHNSAWYGTDAWEGRGFKDRMIPLIGHYREPYVRAGDPVEDLLSGNEAYDVAYVHLLRSLPECRKCSGDMTDEYLELRDNGEDVSDWC